MIELHSHEAIYQATRAHCERHGWHVDRGKTRGEEPSGSVTIRRESPCAVAVACAYTLPRYLERWIELLEDVMVHEDRKLEAIGHGR